MGHIVDSCPVTQLNGGLTRLHEADDDAVNWLITTPFRQQHSTNENSVVIIYYVFDEQSLLLPLIPCHNVHRLPAGA